MKTKKENKINENEFVWGITGSVSGKHLSSVSRHSRKEKLTSRRVTVRDLTTGLSEMKEIPEYHYSKKEMQKLTNIAIDNLMMSLYNKR